MTLIVPFKRTLKRGMKGNDVLATKRGLAKAGMRRWGYGFTRTAGDRWRKDVARFQKKVGLRVDGVYGPKTHAKLIRYFDKYAAYLYNHYHVPSTVISARQRVVTNALFGYNHRGSIYYTQSSLRMYGVKHHIFPPSIPKWEDCSSFATWCYYAAKLPDPNHLSYSGYGYTGTLAAHGTRTFNPRPGDLCFYGRFPYSHVTIYIGNGRVVSHGSNIGPILTTMRYRSDYASSRSYLP